MKALGWDVVPRQQIIEMSIEEGIKATRLVFRQVYFDKAKTERLVQSLKRYRRAINRSTNEPGAAFHDEWSHGADNMRYVAINAESMTNETYTPPSLDDDCGGSWMGA